MLQWLQLLIQLGELSLQILHQLGELLTSSQLTNLHGELENLERTHLGTLASLEEIKLGDLQMTMVRLKIDHERKDASNVAMKDICHENVRMETSSLERKVALSVEKRDTCQESARMETVNNLERVVASSAEVKDIELEIALESKLKFSLKMKNDLEEEVASNVEGKGIEQETAQEKNNL